MSIVAISQLSGVLKDTWRLGIPKEMYTKASPLFGMVAKVRDWSGATLTATAKELVYNYGLRSGLPARGGSTYSDAYAAPGSTQNDEVKVTPNRYYSALRINHDVLDFGVAPEALIEAKAHESEGHVRRTVNVLSKEFWSNGGGVIGKLNGTVATPPTGVALNNAGATSPLVLKNKRDHINFQKGDLIQFASTNGLSGSPHVVVKEVALDPQSNGRIVLTTDIVAGDGVLDTDYIFQKGRFGLAFRGMLAWCPTSSADLSTDFYNLDQTSGKRGGHRINLPAAGEPFAKLLQVLKRAEEVSADLNSMAVTPNFMDALLQSSRYQQFARFDAVKRMGNPLEGMYKDMSAKERMADGTPAGKMRFGIDGICIRWPAANKDVYVYSEKYLTQSEVSAEADDLILGLTLENMTMALPKENGFDWQNHDAVGQFRQVIGDDSVYAMYAVRGQFCHDDPNNIIVAGANVVE